MVQSTTPHEAPAGAPAVHRPTLIQNILRVIQFAFALIVLGTMGAVISDDNKINGCSYGDDYSYTCYYTPHSFGYAIFVAVWTMIVCIYFLASSFVPSIYHIIPALVLEFFSLIFWFASWVSIAAWLGGYSFVFAHVATNKGEALTDTACAFGAFTWLLFVATFVLTLLNYIRSRRSTVTTVSEHPMQQTV